MPRCASNRIANRKSAFSRRYVAGHQKPRVMLKLLYSSSQSALRRLAPRDAANGANGNVESTQPPAVFTRAAMCHELWLDFKVSGQ